MMQVKDSTDWSEMEVYKITNVLNNKLYIGQTINGYINRFKAHLRDAKNGRTTPLHAAMRVHGYDNFKVELVSRAASREELTRLEAETIIKFNSSASTGYGYNIKEPASPNVWHVSDSILYQIFSLAVDENRSFIDIAEALDLTANLVGDVARGNNRPHLREKFESERGLRLPSDFRLRGDDDFLYTLFKERAGGSSLKVLGDRYGINVEWLACVFSGYYRPHLLARWCLEGGGGSLKEIALKNIKQTVSKTRSLKASEGLEFSGLPAAAAHYEVSVQAIYKCIKFMKPLKRGGEEIFFEYTEPLKRAESGAARRTQKIRIAETGEEFDSVKAIAEHFQVHQNEPTRCLKLGRKLLKKWTLERLL
jgi:group I intron endonuclease